MGRGKGVRVREAFTVNVVRDGYELLIESREAQLLNGFSSLHAIYTRMFNRLCRCYNMDIINAKRYKYVLLRSRFFALTLSTL